MSIATKSVLNNKTYAAFEFKDTSETVWVGTFYSYILLVCIALVCKPLSMSVIFASPQLLLDIFNVHYVLAELKQYNILLVLLIAIRHCLSGTIRVKPSQFFR